MWGPETIENLPKIRQGNDFTFTWTIQRDGQPERLADASSLRLTLRGQHGETPIEGYRINENVISIDFTPEMLPSGGRFNIELKYNIADSSFLDGMRECTVDVDAFVVVLSTADADVRNLSATADVEVEEKEKMINTDLIQEASTTEKGLMSAADKASVDKMIRAFGEADSDGRFQLNKIVEELSQTLGNTIVYLGIQRTPGDFYRAVENHPSFRGLNTCIYAASIAENNSRGITFILKNTGQRWVTLYLFENYYIHKMVIEYADKTRTVEQWRSGWRDLLARRMEWKADTRTLRLHNNDGHHGSHSDVQIPLASPTAAGLAPAGYIPRWEKVRTVREGNIIAGYFDNNPPETGDWVCLRGQQNSMKWRFAFATPNGSVSVEFDPLTQHNACLITSSVARSTKVQAEDWASNTNAQFWILKRFPPHP